MRRSDDIRGLGLTLRAGLLTPGVTGLAGLLRWLLLLLLLLRQK